MVFARAIGYNRVAQHGFHESVLLRLNASLICCAMRSIIALWYSWFVRESAAQNMWIWILIFSTKKKEQNGICGIMFLINSWKFIRLHIFRDSSNLRVSNQHYYTCNHTTVKHHTVMSEHLLMMVIKYLPPKPNPYECESFSELLVIYLTAKLTTKAWHISCIKKIHRHRCAIFRHALV